MKNALLLVLDAQAGILQKPVYEADRTIQNINAVAASFDQRRLPVIFSRHTNGTSLQTGSPPWQIDPRVVCPQNVVLLDKKHSNIFHEAEFLKQLEANNIRRLLICGFVSNGCVQAACMEGLKQNKDIVLIKDAHSTFVKHAGAVIESWNVKLAGFGAKVISAESAAKML